MKPYRTFLLLSVVLILLFGPSFFVREPVKIFNDITFSFPPVPDHILSLFSTESISDSHISDFHRKDSCLSGEDSILVEANNQLLPPANQIEFASSDPGWHFFLNALGNPDRQIRILFYGDSQIEEDRLTDSLRSGLRQISGGTGPGLLSITPVVDYTRTSWIKAGREWKRYNYLSYRRGEIPLPSLGPMFSFSRFAGVESQGKRTATVTISPSLLSDPASAWYSRLRMFYGNLDDTLEITLKRGRSIISEDILMPCEGVNHYSRIVESGAGITITMRGRSSPDIYAISLESDSGVIVDNISGRGSAGLEFALAEEESFTDIMQMLNPDLVILHFGLNLVRNNSASYLYYEEALVKQTEVLRKVLPGVPLLIMGVTDMARVDSAGISTFPTIPLIVEAQRNAAIRGNTLFWDSQAAMGGKDAIVKWREENPPLAASDYAHLSYQGAHRIASMLLDAILYEYRLAVPDKAIEPVSFNRMDSANSDLRAVPDDTDLPEQGDPGHNSIPVISSDQESSLKSVDRPEPEGATRATRATTSIVIKAWNVLRGFNPGTPFLFTAVSFWIFLFFLLAGYSLVYSKPFLRNGYLFLFSLFFYYKAGGLFFFLLLVSTFTDYTAARIIFAASRKSVKRLFLVISLIVNLGMLAYFKYATFLTDAVNELFNLSLPVTDWLSVISNRHLGTSFDISVIMLPVGISFFTFQTISYTMDIYRGKIKPVRNLADFGFYVSFFPQLVAGPIVRASEFVPQLYMKFSLSVREWGHALFLILNGLVKKIVVSDYIAVNMIDSIFSAPGSFSGLENLLAVYGYGLQIYCDFSGYTDIAIGVALMLGYRLPVNFNSPYKASSLSDFWRRWHISLSRWLRDYLYIPMGGNRKGKVRTWLNVMITMVLGGLWHGAAWRFLAWGAVHGAGMVAERGVASMKSRFKNRVSSSNSSSTSSSINSGSTARGSRFGKWVAKFAAILLTFNFVSFSWIFFRASGMEEVRIMLLKIFNSFMPTEPIASIKAWGSALIVIFAGYLLHFLPVRVKEAYRGIFISLPLPVKILITWFIGLVLYNISSIGTQPFIYFRF